MKRFIALLLVLCLSLTMLAGCGSKDDEEKDPKPKLVKGDMFDMLEAMGNTTTGVYTVDFTFDVAGQKGKGTITCSMNAEKKSSSFGLNVDVDVQGQNIKFGCDEIAKVADSSLYLNLKDLVPKVVDFAGTFDQNTAKVLKDSIDTSKLGWFEFPLPDDMPDYNDKLQKKYVNSFVSLVEKMLKNTQMDGEDGDYTAVLKTKEDYAQVVTAMRDFVKSDLRGIVEDSQASLTDVSFDIEKYFDKLVSKYKNDVIEIGKDYGITEDYLNQMIQSVKDMKLNDQFAEYKKELQEATKEKTISDEEINEMVSSLDKAIEQLKAFEGEVPMTTTIRVAADEDTYVADLKLDVKSEEATGTITLKFTVKPGDPGVKAPDDTMSVKTIADMVAPFLNMNPGPVITPTDGPEPIDNTPTPTPTEAPVDTPTPVPTDVPADTPTPEPTDAPEATPTPDPGTGTGETGFSNGKASVALGNGKTLTFDMAGDWELFDASDNNLMLSKGGDFVSFSSMDLTGMESQYQTLLNQYASTYTQIDSIDGWEIYELTSGMSAGVKLIDSTLVIVSIMGDNDFAKTTIESMSNVSVQ